MLERSTLLSAIRELMAGFLAITMVVLFLLLVWRAIGSLPSGNAGTDFTPVKELLALVNPTIGVIVGYYFSRVTSEARAERAEATAETAGRVAQDSSQAQVAATQRAQSATDGAQEGAIQCAV